MGNSNESARLFSNFKVIAVLTSELCYISVPEEYFVDKFQLFQAYKQELYGSSYVWILSAPTLHTGWLSPEGTTCTMEELLMAAEGHFTLNNLLMSLSEEPTITGKVHD